MMNNFMKNLIVQNEDSHDHPKPKSVKITKSNSFPERNTVYDFCFEKKASGQWIEWMDTIDKAKLQIAPSAKVRVSTIGYAGFFELAWDT